MAEQKIDLGPIVAGEASEAESAMIDTLEAQADEQIAADVQAEQAGAGGDERTTIRWDTAQLEVVRQAAQAYGMPYQNYIKDAAFRRALADLQSLGAGPQLKQRRTLTGRTTGSLTGRPIGSLSGIPIG